LLGRALDRATARIRLGGTGMTMAQVALQGTAPAAAPRADAATTIERLSAVGTLPALPHVATTALAATRDERASAEKLADIIKADVGLTACILRLANSAAFARRTPATTLPSAITTVGLRRTYNILLAARAQQIHGDAGRHASVLWKHALAVGIAAEDLARRTRRVDPLAAFLPGLFHDIGRIIFLLVDAPAYEAVLQGLEAGQGDGKTLEREWYGFDHAEAGAELARTWGLDPGQIDAIRWHHAPEQAAVAGDLAALIGAGDALAYAIDAGSGPQTSAGTGLAALGLSPENEAACLASVRDQLAQQLAAFG
jgi:putative nucleotidyltransferase with HDIG domain